MNDFQGYFVDCWCCRGRVELIYVRRTGKCAGICGNCGVITNKDFDEIGESVFNCFVCEMDFLPGGRIVLEGDRDKHGLILVKCPFCFNVYPFMYDTFRHKKTEIVNVF